jgi:hypothetical protein
MWIGNPWLNQSTLKLFRISAVPVTCTSMSPAAGESELTAQHWVIEQEDSSNVWPLAKVCKVSATKTWLSDARPSNPPRPRHHTTFQKGRKMLRHLISHALVMALAFGTSAQASAAQGEMGTGIPRFGNYATWAGGPPHSIVWQLENASTPFPAGCTSLNVTAATMGMDVYKIAIATMTVARVSGRSVRFFAHAPRDGGCGVDYVELV